jgi:hypothetical protein
MNKGYKISSKTCKKEVEDEDRWPTEHRIYGHNLSRLTPMTRTEYTKGRAERAKTFAQNIVRGGKAPSPKKAIKEEI